jgi:fatty acid desaturase
VDYKFVHRSELKAQEWDQQAKQWNRPEIDSERLRNLNRRSVLEGGARIIVHLGLVAVTGWLTAVAMRSSILLALPPFLAYLWLVGFLHGIEHEMRHKIVLTRSLDWLSDTTYFLIHVLWKAGSRNQRVSHVLHHRYTMVLGVDPEPAFPENLSTRWVRRELLGFLLTLLTLGIIDFFKAMWALIQRTGGRLHPMIQANCGDKDLRFIRRESFAVLVINVAGLVGCALLRRWDLILLLMLAPHMGLAIGAFYHRTEHIGMMYNTNDQRLCTRGVKVCPVTKFFYGGLDEHVEHHLFPAVPSRNLAKLREALPLSIPGRMNVIACWREIFAIARHQESHPDDVFVPAGV